MTDLSFTKMHGTGNDYIVIADFDDQIELSEAAVQQLCDRHFGIGADCLVRIVRSSGSGSGSGSEWFLDFRNGDGSLSPFCANGVRCVGKWLGDRRLVSDEFDIEVRAGTKSLQLNRSADGSVDTVVVDMGKPDCPPEVVEHIEINGQSLQLSCLSMGNPHAVLFVDDVDAFPLHEVGTQVQQHAVRFPEGVNFEIAAVQPDGTIRQRTLERGVGETLACGTGAAAVAVAAQRRGLVDGPTVEINLLGGPLTLQWSEGGSVVKTGSARQVFEGTLLSEVFGVVVRP
jgi:diaminopimelate epimerase